jgi:hypothetical protein
MEGCMNPTNGKIESRLFPKRMFLRLNVICNFIGGSPIRQKGFLILGVISVEGPYAKGDRCRFRNSWS